MNNAGIFNSQEPILPSVKVTVLLIDDQVIIAEALRRMVGEQEDIEFHYVSDAESALQTAIELVTDHDRHSAGSGHADHRRL